MKDITRHHNNKSPCDVFVKCSVWSGELHKWTVKGADSAHYQHLEPFGAQTLHFSVVMASYKKNGDKNLQTHNEDPIFLCVRVAS